MAVSSLPKLNKWSNVYVHHLAIGPEHSQIQFASNLGGSSGPYGLSKKYKNDAAMELETVECAGVDELVFEKGLPEPDLIKFDLESAEVFALKNGPKLFKNKRPVILLELHGQEALVAAGLFLETYRYKAVSVHEMNSPTKKIFSNEAELVKLETIPHMIYCYPV